MAEGSSRGNRKRSFAEESLSDKPPPEKRVRFPKGKKVKPGDYVTDLGEDYPVKDAQLAAKNRATRRNKIAAELLDDDGSDFVPDVTTAEVQYEESETFVEEGVQMEPFNLDREREEGYFDENGNYVEYVDRNEIKDAWLDSLDIDRDFAEKKSIPVGDDNKPTDLSTEELAKINRRIADILEPEETVLRALRRLKGSSDKKQKMPAEIKQQFDQLTEDAMKLMENGDYNVYDERQEHFKREAEGFERIVNARRQSTKENDSESLDMFGDDDDDVKEGGGGNASTVSVTSNGTGSVSAQSSESDFVYDESSGYYYSSSLGYYYDPSSGLYCCAADGKWYSYNEATQTYEVVQQYATSGQS